MEAPASDYQYDVFFSYKRHRLTAEWTRRVQEQLQHYLSLEMGREASLFVDEQRVEVGDRWPMKLRTCLQLSRCLVCVWSPTYFQSDWCVSEWQSFREREKRLGLSSHGLIAPVRFHDGDHFPQEAREVQWIDVAPYTSTLPAFWASHRALELEDRLKELAAVVAKLVRGAPAFAPDWPIVEASAAAGGKIELARL